MTPTGNSQCDAILAFLKKGQRKRVRKNDISTIAIGSTLGPFTVLGYEHHGKAWHLVVRCFCGIEKVVQRGNAARSKSCGCLTKSILHDARTVHGHAKNWGVESRTYKTWRSMIDRCEKPNHKSFADYGGRGIQVCDRWHSFAEFLADMGERPAGKTLGRLDNAQGYRPGNCAWETYKQQANNRRSSVFLCHAGRTATLAEWAERLGLSHDTLLKRLENGWSVERALTTPAKAQKNSRGTWLAAPRLKRSARAA